MKLLGIGTDAKTIKGVAFNWMTGILYLAPADESKVANLCPHASEGCRLSCLFSAGRGAFSNVRDARVKKTLYFVKERFAFLKDVSKDIVALQKKAQKKGLKPCVRLNGTSDVPWENVKDEEGKTLMERHSDVQFYDYTKNPNRMKAYLKGEMPSNYHLTFSRSESNQKQADEILKLGGNVAIVYKNPPAPSDKVVNGDLSDLRFTDPDGVIVALKAKGKAKKDTSGFVL
jgi:hypothetical protein